MLFCCYYFNFFWILKNIFFKLNFFLHNFEKFMIWLFWNLLFLFLLFLDQSHSVFSSALHTNDLLPFKGFNDFRRGSISSRAFIAFLSAQLSLLASSEHEQFSFICNDSSMSISTWYQWNLLIEIDQFWTFDITSVMMSQLTILKYINKKKLEKSCLFLFYIAETPSVKGSVLGQSPCVIVSTWEVFDGDGGERAKTENPKIKVSKI